VENAEEKKASGRNRKISKNKVIHQIKILFIKKVNVKAYKNYFTSKKQGVAAQLSRAKGSCIKLLKVHALPPLSDNAPFYVKLQQATLNRKKSK